MPTRMLTVKEWADLYQIPVAAVRRQIREGRIRAVKAALPPRNDYRIPATEVDRYNRENATAA